jgi:hypothetical protein
MQLDSLRLLIRVLALTQYTSSTHIVDKDSFVPLIDS